MRISPRSFLVVFPWSRGDGRPSLAAGGGDSPGISRRTSLSPFRVVRLFYAAALALSLMPGKYCLASTPSALPATALAAAPSPATPQATPPATPAAIATDAGITETANREFVAARNAFERRDIRALTNTRNGFRGVFKDYPLASYVDYWWLLANLGQGNAFAVTNAADFSAFLAAQSDGVLGEKYAQGMAAFAGQAGPVGYVRAGIPAAQYRRRRLDLPSVALSHGAG